MSQMGFNAISIKGRKNWKLTSLDFKVLITLVEFEPSEVVVNNSLLMA